jgi:dTDP-4-dehydrorhamnose reductase
MSTILVIWSKGMLWSQLLQKYISDEHVVIGVDKTICDIADLVSVKTIVWKIQPDRIINCAAYTAVDLCESESKIINFQINALGVYNIALVCQIYQIKLIHISTDYVFDGIQKEWYMPYDNCNPINMYGMAKYIWEQLIQTILQKNNLYIIIRTSRLYGWWLWYRNFVNTIIKLSQQKLELEVVNDQYGSPTSTQTLIDCITNCIDHNLYLWKIIHCTDRVELWGITWYDFAQEIISITKSSCIIQPCLSTSYPRPAIRPPYSYLINTYEKANNRKIMLQQYIMSLS